MTLQGLHVEAVDPNSFEYGQHSSHFSGRLVKLYRISYEGSVPRIIINGGWSSELFFHGTGHCGCLGERVVDTSSATTTIHSSEWCGSLHCATQGILNHGHLRTWSHNGHFFSPNVSIASSYAQSKSANNPFLPFFMCKVRNFHDNGNGICSVQKDSDIHPCFLAIVRNG
ncbi:hypothetical protein EDD21DRAFT_449193 [Dissophora ornata]|nr:hypothetical protein EDD21DRAFT_449193 [Dissophora ornata]